MIAVTETLPNLIGLNAIASVSFLLEEVRMPWVFCFVFPPLAVLFTGRIGAALLDCVLTVFFWIPGVIHALAEVNSVQNARNTNKIVEELRRQGRR